MSKELLTASAMTTFLSCPRLYFLRYRAGGKGMKPVVESDALSFGTAVHAALQARAEGASIDELLPKDAIATETDAKLYALVHGYDRCWSGDADIIQSMKPEIEFGPDPIAGSRTFVSAGKIDGLANLKDGRVALVEHKTCGEDISDGAEYWTRLSFNTQLYKYVLALRARNIQIDTVIYDVIRKPTIKPGAGQTAKDYADRILADATGEGHGDNPRAKDYKRGASFYFRRMEVAIPEGNLEEYAVQERGVAHALVHYMSEERTAKNAPEYAWPRNCNGLVCKSCEFSGPCLNRTPVGQAPWAGFRYAEKKNEELSVTATA